MRNLNKITATFILLFSIYLLMFSLSAILAEIYSIPAQSVGETSSVKELDFALGYLYKAKNIQKSNGYWSELEGALLLLKSRISASNDKEDILKQSVTAFQKSITAAPENARLWGDLAIAKASSGEFDDEFYRAYRKAYDYGGWEFQANWVVAEVGFAGWYSINAETRLITKESAIRLYKLSPDQTLALAAKYGQLYMACLWVRDFASQDAVCNSALQTN